MVSAIYVDALLLSKLNLKTCLALPKSGENTLEMTDPIYVVYGFYESLRGDEIEHDSIAAFLSHDDAMDYGIDLIRRFRVSDYVISKCRVPEFTETATLA